MKIDVVSIAKTIPNKAVQGTGKVGSFIITTAHNALKNVEYKNPITYKTTSKETLIGAAALFMSFSLAMRCAKGIINKIKETRNK